MDNKKKPETPDPSSFTESPSKKSMGDILYIIANLFINQVIHKDKITLWGISSVLFASFVRKYLLIETLQTRTTIIALDLIVLHLILFVIGWSCFIAILYLAIEVTSKFDPIFLKLRKKKIRLFQSWEAVSNSEGKKQFLPQSFDEFISLETTITQIKTGKYWRAGLILTDRGGGWEFIAHIYVDENDPSKMKLRLVNIKTGVREMSPDFNAELNANYETIKFKIEKRNNQIIVEVNDEQVGELSPASQEINRAYLGAWSDHKYPFNILFKDTVLTYK